MQNITIKAGTSAKITLSPKINGSVATQEQLNGVTIYMFFVHQFTNKVYNKPYELVADSNYGGKFTISLGPEDTVAMLGNASENQSFQLQFAIRNADGDVIAEETDSNVVLNIVRWEAGQWLNQNSSTR